MVAVGGWRQRIAVVDFAEVDFSAYFVKRRGHLTKPRPVEILNHENAHGSPCFGMHLP